VTATEVRFGQTAALTGPLSNANIQANAAARAVFAEVNAKGGVFGRQINFVSVDDMYSPVKAIENFKELNDPDKGVFSLFMTGGTPANMALMPQIEEARIPNLAPLAAIDNLHKPELRMFFNIRASYGQEFAKMANYLATQGRKDVAVIYSDNSFGKGALALFETAATAQGVKVVAKILMADKLESNDALTQQIKDSKCQAVIGITSALSALAWAKSEFPKLTVPYVTISLLGNESTVKAIGEAANGIVVAQAVPYFGSRKYPISNAYTALMQKAKVTNLGFVGMEGYIAAQVAVEALQRAGKGLTREGFIAALSGRKFDLKGYVVDFTGGKRSGSSFVELGLVQSGGKFAM
jgi:branched-chain amino acid transport system substrate-binding protein